MHSPHLYIEGKISLIFIIFIVITFGIFAFVMINLSLLPTPEQKRAEFNQHMNDIILAEEAQTTGKTIEELKKQKKRVLNRREIIHNINQSVLGRNHERLKDLLSKLNAPPESSTALVSAVNAKDVDAFSLLLAANFPCSNDTDAGSRAFSASIGSENPMFLNLLLQNSCIYTKQKSQKSIGERIVRSSSPIKIFQLPKLNLIEKFGKKALQSAIRKRRVKQVLTMIDLGADISASNLVENCIKNRIPTVALALIKKGANYQEKEGSRLSILPEAIKQGFIKVSQEILAREPDYITNNKLEKSVFNAVFTIRHQQKRREALSIILNHGVQPAKLINSGSHGLVRAIFYQDDEIVETLLKAGANPNIPDHINLALIVAKSINSPRYKRLRNRYRNDKPTNIETQNKIVDMLEQHGATDNFIQALMQANGLKTIENCSLGKNVNIAFDTLREKNLPISKNNYYQCISLTTACANQGFGSDDCMRTAPNCNNKDKTNYCCDNKIKKQYFEARCSGLFVRETLQWIKAGYGY